MVVASVAGALYITTALKESIGSNFEQIAVQARDKTDLILQREIEGVERLGTFTLVLREETEKANARYAGKSEAEIAREIEPLDNRWIHAPDDDELIQKCLHSRASARLNSHLASRPEKFAELLVTDCRGALIGATGKTSDYYQADEEWWQRAFNNGAGAIYVSSIHRDESAGVVSLDICAPIMDEKREHAIGVLKVVLSAEEILSAISEIHLGETGHAHLVSSNGDVLIDRDKVLPGEKMPAEILARLNSSEPGWFAGNEKGACGHHSGGEIIGISGLRTMSTVSPASFGGERWFVVVEQDTSEASAPVYHLVTVLALAGGCTVIAIILVGFWFAGRIARPIKALHKGTELIGSGQLNHRLDIRTGDEIEQLAHEFNRMADSRRKESDRNGLF
jgi:HAMP domain-containing protein